MNYAQIKPCSIENGTGVRVSLFVSGCRHHCKECFNEETWDFSYGKPFTKTTEDEIVQALAPSYIAGLTLLGGDPGEPENQQGLLPLLQRIKKELPDIVLVHGDTTTSSAAALAAFYQQIPVGPVEAGLRTHNIYSPWPEEMNRQITSRIAVFHFAPTELSRRNLQREGVADGNIYVVGNTVIDALHLVLEQIGVRKDIEKNIQFVLERVGIPLSLLSLWKSGERKMVLITGHRRENFGEGFIHICKAINGRFCVSYAFESECTEADC